MLENDNIVDVIMQVKNLICYKLFFFSLPLTLLEFVGFFLYHSLTFYLNIVL